MRSVRRATYILGCGEEIAKETRIVGVPSLFG